MAHDHHSSHSHHNHAGELQSLDTVFIVSIVLNLLFVIFEAAVGFLENSLGLLSDAGHNLSDVFSLLLALVAFRLAKLPGTERFTYGYRKSTVLISLVNAVILLVAVGAIVVESIDKFSHPVAVNGAAVSWTAGVGIVINGLTAWLLMKNRKTDINVRGAYLHMAADTLVSVGVVLSGLLIVATGWTVVDPIISLVIAAIILVSTFHLLVESVRQSLDAVPETIDRDAVFAFLTGQPRVADVHHLHIWPISTTEVALTAHLVLDDLSVMEEVKESVRRGLLPLGIRHCTLEIESRNAVCRHTACDCSSTPAATKG